MAQDWLSFSRSEWLKDQRIFNTGSAKTDVCKSKIGIGLHSCKINCLSKNLCIVNKMRNTRLSVVNGGKFMRVKLYGKQFISTHYYRD